MVVVLRALVFGCGMPSALLVIILFGTRAWLNERPYLAIEVTWLLYVIVPASMLLSAAVAVFWRHRSNMQHLALGSLIVIGVPGLIALGWLVTA